MSQSNTNIRHSLLDSGTKLRLARISIFPLKSLPECSLAEVVVLPSGGLAGDRLLAMFDSDGAVLNAKRSPIAHTVRAQFDVSARWLELWTDDAPARKRLSFDRDRSEIERWLSDHFQVPISLQEDAENGFPDDPDLSGPTVISTASLREVGSWFGFDLDESRRRFRANLEIDGVPPFWEDCLVGETGQAVMFQIGEVRFAGMNPCQRCPVPSRDSLTGEVTSRFAKQFSQHREQSLPAWATRSRFDHFYRLSVNTRLASSAGGVLRVGDALTLDGSPTT